MLEGIDFMIVKLASSVGILSEAPFAIPNAVVLSPMRRHDRMVNRFVRILKDAFEANSFSRFVRREAAKIGEGGINIEKVRGIIGAAVWLG